VSTPFTPAVGGTIPPTIFTASGEGAEPRVLCGFGARVVALFIDYVVLAAIVALPGIAARHFFAKHSFAALLLGFAAALPYFAILNSEIGKGQTLGKKALGIRVTDRYGDLIPASKSLLRACVFLIPLIFSNAPAAKGGLFSEVWTGVSFLLDAGVFAMVYLYVFNRRTRQVTHDLVAGTFVIRASAWPLPATRMDGMDTGMAAAGGARGVVTRERVWNPHFGIIAGLLTVFCIAGYFGARAMKKANWFSGLPPIHDALLEQPEVENAGVMYQHNFAGGSDEANSIVITIQPGSNFGEDEAEATKMAGIALKASPEASRVGTLTVVIAHGDNFGVFNWSWTRRFSHTPEEWRKILETGNPSKAT